MQIKTIGLCNKDSKNISFGCAPIGCITEALRYADSSKIIGASAVDFVSMVAPRTCIDAGRGSDAGIETFIRENTGLINHAAIGAYALLGATLISGGFKKEFKIDPSKIFATDNTIKVFSDVWKDAEALAKTTGRKTQEIYAEKLIRGLSGTYNDKSVKLIEQVSEKELRVFSKIFAKNIRDNKSIVIPEKIKNQIITKITTRLKANNAVTVNYNAHQVTERLDELLKSAYALAKSFGSEKVINNHDNFLKRLFKINNQKSLIGIALACSIGFISQSVNRYITKKRTGKEGFVGAENSKKDTSVSLKLKKLAAVAGMFVLGIGSICGKNFKNLPQKMHFVGKTPTINQLKMVYMVTIMGRVLASGDKNELRETLTRDPLAFVNWLILGGAVSKAVSHLLDKSTINYIKPDNYAQKSWVGKKLHWLMNSSLKTHDEIADVALNGKVFDETGKRLRYSKIIKELVKKGDNNTKKALTQIKTINKGHIAGLVYASLALGMFIPWFNKYITNKVTKGKANNPTITQKTSILTFANNNMISDKNKALFSNFIQKPIQN